MNQIHKAFTLVELVMVMVIIGILVAIIVPNVFSFRKEANVEAMKSTLLSLSEVSEIYKIKEGAYPADMSFLTTPGSGYLRRNPCGTELGQYLFICIQSPTNYSYIAVTSDNFVGTYTISTGGLRQMEFEGIVRDGWE